jgi:hypothetical protein
MTSPTKPLRTYLPFVRWFRTTLLGALTVAGAVGLATGSVQAEEKVLRVGMTAADIPINIGQPDQGLEGFRFMGDMLYDTLVLWDLSKADEPATLMPAHGGSGPQCQETAVSQNRHLDERLWSDATAANVRFPASQPQ